jgi:HEAT repeat protein
MLATRDASSEVREAAAAVLGRMGDPQACGALSLLLNDPKATVRTAAGTALKNLGWTPATPEEKAVFEVASGNARGAAFAGQAGVKALVTDLKHDTSFKRRAAAEALQEVNDPRALQPLLVAVQDEDPTVRVSAIHALSRQSEAPVTPTLLKLLRDNDPCVRLASAQVLSRRDDANLAQDFINLLADQNFEVRGTAVQFLGRIPDARIAEALIPMLKDSDNDVRQYAAKALGSIGNPKAIEALVMTLIDEEHSVRQAAEGALGQIDRHWTESELARRASSRLEASLEDRPAWVRSAVSQVLAKLRGSSAGVARLSA